MDNQNKLSIRLTPGGFSVSTPSDVSTPNIASTQNKVSTPSGVTTQSAVIPDKATSSNEGSETFVSISPGADFEARIEEAILNIPQRTDARDISCTVETTRISLSPTSYNKDIAEKMYHLSIKDKGYKEVVLHEETEDGKIRVSFGIDANLYHFLLRTFEYADFHHPLTELINKEQNRAMIGNWMTIYASSNIAYFAIFKKNQLQMANCIESYQIANQVYFILNAWTQYEMDSLKDSLFITGEENLVNKLYANLEKFVKHTVK